MARLFELRIRSTQGDRLALLDLDKVISVHVDTKPGDLYESIAVRFVDGHEASDLVTPEHAQRFLDAFRDHLQGPAAPRS